MNIREMKFTKICWLGFAIGQLLVWQNVDATGTPGKHSNIQRARDGRSHEAGNHSTRNDFQSGYVAGLTSNAVENRDGNRSGMQSHRNRRYTQAAEKYAAREQFERDARAERIYRSSQLSAPIIINAKACKRIGTHGDSIYENCQLADTCKARAGVATCVPSG